MDSNKENWVAGNDYDYFMGRWSRLVARNFVEQLALPANLIWLDIGCGTGALTQAIQAYGKPLSTFGLDPSYNFVRHTSQQLDEAHFFVSDGGNLALRAHAVDVVVSGLALNFIPNPDRSLADMYRITKSGGTVAAYVWDYSDKMEFLRYFWDVSCQLDEEAIYLHEGKRFPICQQDNLGQLWQNAGLQNVTVEAIDILTHFDSFEAYWHPFTVGNFPAPKYLSSLTSTGQENLKTRLQNILPTEADQSINLIARVWAVRGNR